MSQINITELRRNLIHYLKEVAQGKEIRVTSRGRVIAHIVPDHSESARAQKALRELCKTAWIGDVESSVEETWHAEHVGL